MEISASRLREEFKRTLTIARASLDGGNPDQTTLDDKPYVEFEPALTIPYAPLGNDNPDQTTLDDKLHVEAEAQAFARVAAAIDVRPPLAFGIFGDWGSGKSSFMRLTHRHVERLQALDNVKWTL
jgi:hypothetical protein